MTIRKSVLMASNTGTQWNHISEPIPGNAFFGYTDSCCTVQIVYQNLVAGFGIQATLSLKPQPEDWFWVTLNPAGNTNYPYLTYPRNPLYPTGSNGGDTGSEAFTFIGNFVYLRSVMTRDYIQPASTGVDLAWSTWIYGQVDSVRLSL